MLLKEPKICIIEDNPEDREIFRRYLLQDIDYRYLFFEEETGEMGLELCKTVHPDCILLDYNLPDIDGLEFLAELADEKGSIPFPVIMLTGLGNESIAIEAMKRGAQDYLVKDEMTPGNLFRAIHNAMERESMRRTLERQRQDLEAKNQEIQAFAYALAHDLRSPLRAITGFAQIVTEDYATVLDANARRYLGNIVRASMQLDRLIDDLLNYTRIEHRSIRYKPVALNQVLKQVLDSLASRIDEVQATITLVDDLPIVYGDPTLINQIFLNLLDNALTYRRRGVAIQVVVTWRMEAQEVIVSICDNGIGIAPKFYDKIFNIFQRLHGDDEYPGTGIGLAIVKKAVELMGGGVWVESVLGQGSTFSVKLPSQV